MVVLSYTFFLTVTLFCFVSSHVLFCSVPSFVASLARSVLSFQRTSLFLCWSSFNLLLFFPLLFIFFEFTTYYYFHSRSLGKTVSALRVLKNVSWHRCSHLFKQQKSFFYLCLSFNFTLYVLVHSMPELWCSVPHIFSFLLFPDSWSIKYGFKFSTYGLFLVVF